MSTEDVVDRGGLVQGRSFCNFTPTPPELMGLACDCYNWRHGRDGSPVVQLFR
jgi:hypothetical protein